MSPFKALNRFFWEVESPDGTPLCVNCEHYSRSYCKESIESVDVVYGTRIYPYAQDYRATNCGVDAAKYYVNKYD